MHKHLALLALILACQTFGSTEQAAHGVLERLLGRRANEFVLTEIPKSNALDVFEVEAKGGKVFVSGSTGVAICRGAYEYLRDACHAMLSWEGVNLPLSKRLPDYAKRRVVCPNRYRHYFNVCTFGYTMTWWDWSRWQREIDWMALHGINMPLAMTGQEAIWQTVFRGMGVSDVDVRGFFGGPAFLPWHRMGNEDGHPGPLPQSWIDGQRDLQKQILNRERELGMTPVVPGFSGFVPRAFAAAHSEAAIDRSSGWCGFEPTYLLSGRDPLFLEVGKRFITEYRRVFGTDHLYLCDTFNEMTPQVKPETKLQELADMGRSVYNSILAGDPDGIWVMQGWLFLNDSFWGQREVGALLDAVPDERMVVIDLGCDLMEVWRAQPSVRRKQWIECTLHNFGQTTQLFGDIRRYAETVMKALADPGHGNMAGMGITPEGIDQNPVVYELMTDLMWRDKPVDVAEWLDGYCRSRYGSCPPAVHEAWKLLLETVYAGRTMPGSSSYFVRPGPGRGTTELGPDTDKLRRAVELLISCAGRLGKNELYRRDVVDVMKRYLADVSGLRLGTVTDAFERGDKVALTAATAAYQSVLLDLDRLLATRPEHRLSTWIAAARKWGKTAAEQDFMEENARMQATVWGGPILHDYAWKEWAGLIADFYSGRWRIFFDALGRDKSRPYDAGATERALADWEWAWTGRTVPPVESPGGDSIKVARTLQKKNAVTASVDRGIAVSKPVTASSNEAGQKPENAVDGYAGDPGVGWYANPYPQWLMVDLQKPERIGRIHIFPYWGDGRHYQYTIEVSTDREHWRQVVDMSKNTLPSTPRGDDFTFPPADARYVRLNMLFNSANVGVHVIELRVFRAK